MKNDKNLVTPIYFKKGSDFVGPQDERAYYMLAGNGLFICRNHAFYESCVPARTWPTELAPQRDYLLPRYPKLSRKKFEQVVGFFTKIADLHGSEAGVLLAWDENAQCVEVIVPEQEATVSSSSTGEVFPIGLNYQIPTDLPPGKYIFGDIHSHVGGPAYASGVDKHDEMHQPGLHIVIGKIWNEPPEIHCEAVVDGSRFTMKQEWAIGGYKERNLKVPGEWIERVSVPPPSWSWPASSGYSYSSSGYGSSGYGNKGYGSTSDTSSSGSWESRSADDPTPTEHSSDGAGRGGDDAAE